MRNLMSKYQARHRYFTARESVAAALHAVATSNEPYNRMLALWEVADAALAMAQAAHGFRNAAQRDADGFSLAASCDLAARVVGLVADTEAALWWGDPSSVPVSYGLDLPVSDDADAVLAALRTEPRAEHRGELVLALYHAVVDLVGDQAAETLAALAACYFQLSGLSREDSAGRVWTNRGELA